MAMANMNLIGVFLTKLCYGLYKRWRAGAAAGAAAAAAAQPKT